MNDAEQMRAEFEGWFGPAFLDRPKWDEKRNCYTDLAVHMAWNGYRAGYEAAIAACAALGWKTAEVAK